MSHSVLNLLLCQRKTLLRVQLYYVKGRNKLNYIYNRMQSAVEDWKKMINTAPAGFVQAMEEIEKARARLQSQLEQHKLEATKKVEQTKKELKKLYLVIGIWLLAG